MHISHTFEICENLHHLNISHYMVCTSYQEFNSICNRGSVYTRTLREENVIKSYRLAVNKLPFKPFVYTNLMKMRKENENHESGSKGGYFESGIVLHLLFFLSTGEKLRKTIGARRCCF